MGNQPSSASDNARAAVRGLLRTTNQLGLSKTELDERCKPSGLYPSCQWEDKAIRRLIGDGKIAARLRGTENRKSPTDRECPICFLQYKQVNLTKCCSALLCTECYLQVRPQREKSPSCPFCNHNRMTVTVASQMDADAVLAREETEQRVIEAKIRDRAKAEQAAPDAAANHDNPNNDESSASGFGSSLEQNERVAILRARSSSLSEHDPEANIPRDVLASFAMSPEERRMLEEEMRSQNSHPLSLRLQAEAEERRVQNEREFLRANSNSSNRNNRRSSRGMMQHQHVGGPRRDWNQIVEAFERGGNGEVNSLDDLVVLEAAMILSMEEEARRNSNSNNDASSSINNNAARGSATTGFSFLDAMAGAGGATTAANNNNNNFDANRHANQGFPLVRSILTGRPSSGGQQQQQQQMSVEQMQAMARTLYSRRRGRNSLLRGGDGAAAAASTSNLDTALDTAGLLMRGVSEEEQLAMAIAASLQDSSTQPENDEAAAAVAPSDQGRSSNTASAAHQERNAVESSFNAGTSTNEEHATTGVSISSGNEASNPSEETNNISSDPDPGPPSGPPSEASERSDDDV